jgi:hypothetical protein
VQRGGDKPFHTVINGENFHALEALTFTHRGKIDARPFQASGSPPSETREESFTGSEAAMLGGGVSKC